MANKPKIRFKGFDDAWEQRKWIDSVDISTEMVDPTSSEYADMPHIAPGNIESFTGRILDNVKTVKEEQLISGKFRFRPDDVVYGKINPQLGKYFYASVDGLTSADAYVFKGKNGTTQKFLFSLLQTNEFFKYSVSVSKRSGMPKINRDELNAYRFFSPNKEEQDKIGVLLLGIDHLITLHQRKCDQMKELKKYMLTKMFPQNGAKVPEIRFDGFTDDWEQRKFADYYKMSSGYAFKMTDYCDDGVGLINGESIQHGIINDDNLNHLPESFIQQYPEFVLKEGDIVVGLNRPITNGNLKIARIPSKYNNSMLYQRAGKIVYKAECDKDFSYILLSQEILKHTLVEAVGSDQPFISTSKLDKWKIMMPMNTEEQEKIGVYFSNLDHLITLHQHKCDKLREMKKYMLKNMFI